MLNFLSKFLLKFLPLGFLLLFACNVPNDHNGSGGLLGGVNSFKKSGPSSYDFMVFANAYRGDSGIGRVIRDSTNNLQLLPNSVQDTPSYHKSYRGFFVRGHSSDMERSLLYDMLGRQKIEVLFFLYNDPFPIVSLAARYPQPKFILPYSLNIGRYTLPPNLRMAWIRLEQGAFLAGIIAGKMTRNNRIGMLLDMPEKMAEIPMYAFVQGVRKINSSSKIIITLTDSAESMLVDETTRLISVDDIDIMFAMSANYNDEIIRSAYYLSDEVLLINSWYDADVEWPRHVITSLVISFEPIMRDFMALAKNEADFNSLPATKIYGLSDRKVLRFSWDEHLNTEFEIARPEYSEQSRQTRRESKKWAQRIRAKKFVVFDALRNGVAPAELQDFQFRDSRRFPVDQ